MASPFDYLVGILLDADYGVVRGAVIPHAVVAARARPIAYNNGWRLHMASGLLGLAEVRDVTTQLQEAAEG